MPSALQLARLNEFAKRYDAVAKSYPSWIRRDVALAQAVLETGWFDSALYRNSNNAFGMRPSSRTIHVGVTDSYFARYKSVEDSIRDYLERQRQFDATKNLAFSRSRSAREYVQALQSPPAYALEAGYGDAVLSLVEQMPDTSASTSVGAPAWYAPAWDWVKYAWDSVAGWLGSSSKTSSQPGSALLDRPNVSFQQPTTEAPVVWTNPGTWVQKWDVNSMRWVAIPWAGWLMAVLTPLLLFGLVIAGLRLYYRWKKKNRR